MILKRCESCGGLPKCKVVSEGGRGRLPARELMDYLALTDVFNFSQFEMGPSLGAAKGRGRCS